MTEITTNICFGAFFICTVILLRRAKYSWVASILAGLVSPLVFIMLYTMLGFPLSMLAGALHIPESTLPQNVLSCIVTVIVILGWLVGGLLLTRKKQPSQPSK